MKFKYVLGILFLLFQICSIVYARFIPERFFCWAPYDEHTSYTISVKTNGQSLSKQEIKRRYHYQSVGWEPRAIDNVFDLIEQYETTNGLGDKAQVNVKYSTNGRKEKVWHFPKN